MLSYVCYFLNCNFIVKRVSEEGDQEDQLNATVLTEDPDQSSEEPKAILASDYREGKPRTTHISNYYNLSLLLTCAFNVLKI